MLKAVIIIVSVVSLSCAAWFFWAATRPPQTNERSVNPSPAPKRNQPPSIASSNPTKTQGDAPSLFDTMKSKGITNAKRVSADEDVYKLMKIREVSEAEKRAFEKELEENTRNKSTTSTQISPSVKKLGPGDYRATENGLEKLKPGEVVDPNTIFTVPEKVDDNQ